MNENSPKKVVLMGSTGSIGTNALIELLEHRSDFKVLGLVAHDNIELLSQQAALLGAEYVVTTNEMRFQELKVIAPKDCIAASGMEAVLELVSRRDVDIVLCAILGNAAIRPALAALDAGKHLALASKEVLCAAGELVMAAAKRNPNSKIVPVDSEHSGLFQCLQGRDRRELAKLWFTASGGPFRNFSLEQLANVTLEQALKHPVWSMGAKITIDSASMMNKALEFIETHYLFDMPESCIDAVIHPQAKVHALVELVDGTFIAQFSAPDMRMAVRYGLSYPMRLPGTAERLDFKQCLALDFSPIDAERFPSVAFAREALRKGGTMPTVLNAANDVAVNRFMRGEIRFTGIWRIVEKTMDAMPVEQQESVSQLEAIDQEARSKARNF